MWYRRNLRSKFYTDCKLHQLNFVSEDIRFVNIFICLFYLKGRVGRRDGREQEWGRKRERSNKTFHSIFYVLRESSELLFHSSNRCTGQGCASQKPWAGNSIHACWSSCYFPYTPQLLYVSHIISSSNFLRKVNWLLVTQWSPVKKDSTLPERNGEFLRLVIISTIYCCMLKIFKTFYCKKE